MSAVIRAVAHVLLTEAGGVLRDGHSDVAVALDKDIRPIDRGGDLKLLLGRTRMALCDRDLERIAAVDIRAGQHRGKCLLVEGQIGQIRFDGDRFNFAVFQFFSHSGSHGDRRGLGAVCIAACGVDRCGLFGFVNGRSIYLHLNLTVLDLDNNVIFEVLDQRVAANRAGFFSLAFLGLRGLLGHSGLAPSVRGLIDLSAAHGAGIPVRGSVRGISSGFIGVRRHLNGLLRDQDFIADRAVLAGGLTGRGAGGLLSLVFYLLVACHDDKVGVLGYRVGTALGLGRHHHLAARIAGVRFLIAVHRAGRGLTLMLGHFRVAAFCPADSAILLIFFVLAAPRVRGLGRAVGRVAAGAHLPVVGLVTRPCAVRKVMGRGKYRCFSLIASRTNLYGLAIRCAGRFSRLCTAWRVIMARLHHIAILGCTIADIADNIAALVT